MWRSVPVFLLGLLGLTVAALALEPPVADFSWSPSEPSTRDTVHFHDRSHDPDGWIVSWRWDFGDGHTSRERNPSHRYSRPGTYTVTLKVTDDDGLSDTATAQITVLAERGELAPLIEETEPGGTLLLKPGIYYANVTIAKDIKIKGAGPDRTLIVGREAGARHCESRGARSGSRT